MKRFIFLGLFLASLGSILFSGNVFALTPFEQNLNFTDQYIAKNSKDSPMDVSNSFRTIIRSACNSESGFSLYLNNKATCEEALKILDNTFSKQGDYIMSVYYHGLDSGNVVSTTSVTPRLFVSESGMLYNHTSGKSNFVRSDSVIYSFSFSYSSKPPHTGYSVSIYRNIVFTMGYSSSDFPYSDFRGDHKIYSAKLSNIPEYSSDYNGKKIEDSSIDFTPKTGYEEFTTSIFEEFKQCQAFDLGCLVENFLIFIRNIFTFIIKLPEFIVEIFKFLFVPDQEFLATYFEDMKAYAVENSGLLKIPVTVFNSFMKMIRDVVGNSGNSAQNLIIHLNMMLGNGFNCGLYDSNSPYKPPQGNVCSGNYLGSVSFFGKEFQIDQSIYPIVDKFLVYIRIFLQGSLALMLIGLFYKRIQIYAGRAF